MWLLLLFCLWLLSSVCVVVGADVAAGLFVFVVLCGVAVGCVCVGLFVLGVVVVVGLFACCVVCVCCGC